jgi:hypothetical protein
VLALVKQTSATDTTAGAVLVNGAHGLGGLTTVFTDFDALMAGGVSQLAGAGNTALNPPLGIGDNWTCLYQSTSNTNRASQIAMSLGNGRTFLRFRSAGVNTAWTEVFTSSGTNAITVDTGSIGYATGSGGTVTQATSKSTAVTLNKPSGQITLNGASLAANTAASFTLTNNKISSSDVPVAAIKSGATAGAYIVQVDEVAAGSCRISIRNMTAGALAEVIVMQFNVIKGATA